VTQDETSENQRPDYIAEIYKLCTTLSTEAVDAAEAKAEANQFKIDRGDITFTELAINLTSARDILRDAIEKEKLIQLPLTVQKNIFANLSNISKALQGLMNNSDEIINLGNAVEALNTSIWQYGLHNLSDQVLGYQTKINQIKQQEVQIKQLVKAVEDGRLKAERLTTLFEKASADQGSVESSRQAVEADVTTVSTARQQAQEELAKVNQVSSSVQQTETQMTQYISAAKLSIANIAPIEETIKAFFTEVDTYRRQISSSMADATKFLTDSSATVNKSMAENEAKVSAEIDRLALSAKTTADTQALSLTSQLDANKLSFTELVGTFNKNESLRLAEMTAAAAAQLTTEQIEHASFVAKGERKLAELESQLQTRSDETIEKNRVEVEASIKELNELKERVKEQVAQATGLGQFGAFQSRQNTISAGKYWWVVAIGGLVLTVVLLTFFIALHAQQGDLHSAAFWIKLSMNVPLGFLITFCTLQYSRERRLEEEYAFKASISVSLTPYRDMIYSMLEKDGKLADGTYTSFVIDAVRNVFTSPTEKIFDSPKKIDGVSEKSLKATAELIGTVVKAAK
jgi:hypothetical protein